jgi:predicted SprT family Zn-dependent metalloprotease
VKIVDLKSADNCHRDPELHGLRVDGLNGAPVGDPLSEPPPETNEEFSLNCNAQNTNPTKKTYDALNTAYDFFNQRLFAGQLPGCLITMQRKSGALGFFDNRRFGTRDETEIIDEIGLNPQHFKERSTKESLSTLVHEMVHQRQHISGIPSPNGYHNREWAAMMKKVGLYPSRTGEQGGKETGQRVSHYIVPGGPFDLVCGELLRSGYDLVYIERGGDEKQRKAKTAGKTKYVCLSCNLNAWAKPDVLIICGECQESMQPDQSH